jgi:hypothetical protein
MGRWCPFELRRNLPHMFASLTTTQGPGKDMLVLAEMTGETMLTWLGDIDGFEGLIMLSNESTGRTLLFTFWESREVAERHRAARMQLRDRITETVGVEVEETESYDVSFSDVPALREPSGRGPLPAAPDAG